jgi:tight adherence protein B
MTALAVALAALAAALMVPAAGSLPARRRPSGGRVNPLLVVLAGAGGGAALWSWLPLQRFVLAAILVGLLGAVVRLVRRRRAARAADERSEHVLAVCDAMASDLAVGQPPLLCLEHAASQWPEFAPVATAGRMGADVPAQLRELAQRPGAGELSTLAATWQVAHDTGAGLAAAMVQAAGVIRDDRRTNRLVAAELAAAHATARMLALLPVGVLLLGAGVGGDPIGFLTGSLPGLCCLALGLGLSFLGMLWLDRIADQVLRR